MAPFSTHIGGVLTPKKGAAKAFKPRTEGHRHFRTADGKAVSVRTNSKTTVLSGLAPPVQDSQSGYKVLEHAADRLL